MRNCLLFAFICLAGLIWVPGVAAAQGEAAGWGWIETLGRWVNLFILFGAIYYVSRAPLKNFLENRRRTLQLEIREARESKERAESSLKEMQERMSRLQEELQELKAEAQRESELERRRLLADAERDAGKVVEAARREISGMTQAAVQELKDYAAELSVRLAEEKIRGEMTDEDNRRLVDRFVIKLGPGEEA